MEISVIFTGGTIGSRVNEQGVLTPREQSPYFLLEEYNRQYGNSVEFTTAEPYRILSENLDAPHLLSLISSVNAIVERGETEGIVITHGTDTLCYSAAVLGYVFGDVDIPIVLVSSDYILQDSRSNGLVNFHYALEFIRGRYGTGVFVSHQNRGGIPTIHRGTRLLQQPPLSGEVNSIKESWYGRFEKGMYQDNPCYRVLEGESCLFPDKKKIKLSEQESVVMRLIPFVGMSYPELSRQTRAVLHESYHSGTVAISPQLERFMQRARELEIPVFLCGLPGEEREYETVSQYKAMGMRPLAESAPVAQYCKLWLAVSNGLDVERVMNTLVAEDFIL